MAFSADGAFLAAGSTDRSVSVWDMEQGYYTHKLKGHTAVVTCVAFRPSSGARLELLSGADDGEIRAWDLETRECRRKLENHLSAITDFAFVDRGRALVSVGRDKVLNVWDLDAGSLLRTIPVYQARFRSTVSFIRVMTAMRKTNHAHDAASPSRRCATLARPSSP